MVQEDLINIIHLQETQDNHKIKDHKYQVQPPLHKVVLKEALININLLQETQDNYKIKDHKYQVQPSLHKVVLKEDLINNLLQETQDNYKIKDIKEDKDQAPITHIKDQEAANTHNLIVLIQDMFKMAIILIISEEEIT